jgi:hypothetical protein
MIQVVDDDSDGGGDGCYGIQKFQLLCCNTNEY